MWKKLSRKKIINRFLNWFYERYEIGNPEGKCLKQNCFLLVSTILLIGIETGGTIFFGLNSDNLIEKLLVFPFINILTALIFVFECVMIRTAEKEHLKILSETKIVNKTNIFIDLPLVLNTIFMILYYLSYLFNYKVLTIILLLLIAFLNIIFSTYKIVSSTFSINPK